MTENDRFEEAPLTAGQGEAESPLHAAAWVGDVAQIKRLIADGADVNWRDSSGETALFGAASWGETEAVRCLLAAGARHDIAEKYGYTALHWAASHGNAATLRLLLVAGADMQARNVLDKTPLDVARAEHRPILLEALRNAGFMAES